MASQTPQDDITQATYTARSFALASGEPADAHEARIDAALASLNLPVIGGNPHAAHRDTSLEGAGTGGAGAGFVKPEELKEQMEHKRDPVVDNATYTARSQYIGSSPSVPDPTVRPNIRHTATSPHIPGEFPSELGEDVVDHDHGHDHGRELTAAAPLASLLDNSKSGTISGADLPSHGNGSHQILTTTNAVEQPKPSSQHDISRDTKLVGGAGFLGATALGAHEITKDKDTSSITQPPLIPYDGHSAPIGTKPTTTGNNDTADGPHYSPVSTSSKAVVNLTPKGSTENTISNTTSTPIASRDVQSSYAPQQVDHSTSTAAGLGAAGVGAVGLGAHELDENKDIDRRLDLTTVGQQTGGTGLVDTTAGHGNEKQEQSSTAAPHTSDLANQLDPRVTSDPEKVAKKEAEKKENESHIGRNAAVVGGVGAAGVGAYELSKDTRDETGSARGTIGPHDSNIANILDPRVKPDIEKQRQEAVGKSSEPSVSSAAFSSVPQAAADRVQTTNTQGYDGTGPAAGTIGPHESNVANILDPRVKPDVDQQRSKAQERKDDIAAVEQGHTGRDLALGAGAGAVGVGAYEAGKDRSPNDVISGSGSSTVTPRDNITTNTPASTLVSDSDQPKLKAAERKSEIAAVEQGHSGGSVALGAGAGMAGVAAYEVGKGESATNDGNTSTHNQTQIPYGNNTRETGLSGTSDPHTLPIQSNTLVNPSDPPESSHLGRDAAIVGGVGGAAALGAHELGKNSKIESGPASKTIGPHESNIANVLDPRVKPEPSLMRNKENQPPQTATSSNQQHSGRDATILGGAGAAGLAAEDYRKQNVLDQQQGTSQKDSHGLFGRHRKEEEPIYAKDKHGHGEKQDHSLFGRSEPKEEPRTQTEQSTSIVPAGVAATPTSSHPSRQMEDLTEDNLHHNRVSVDGRGHHKLHKKAIDQSPRTSVDKHDRALQEARADEAAIGGDRGQVKHGFLHKILHPREHKREKQAAEEHRHNASLDHPILDQSQVQRSSFERHSRD